MLCLRVSTGNMNTRWHDQVKWSPVIPVNELRLDLQMILYKCQCFLIRRGYLLLGKVYSINEVRSHLSNNKLGFPGFVLVKIQVGRWDCFPGWGCGTGTEGFCLHANSDVSTSCRRLLQLLHNWIRKVNTLHATAQLGYIIEPLLFWTSRGIVHAVWNLEET